MPPSTHIMTFESMLSKSMVDQALTDPIVQSVLMEIAVRLRQDILPVIRKAVLAEQGMSVLTPALKSLFGSLAMQHSAGDKWVGALLPNKTHAELESTTEGRELLLTAIEQCLRDAEKINHTNQFISLLKCIDGMAFAYGTDIFAGVRTCSDYENIKSHIAPSQEEVGIRSLREEDVVATTYGIGTAPGSDLALKKDVINSCRSGKARFFISSPAGRHRTWFEQLADQSRLDKPSLPLIASPSNAAAKSFIMAHGMGLFTDGSARFHLGKAQVFANCVMAYLVYCGHHSFLEVMEIWNRALDFLVMHRPDQLATGIIPATPTMLPYFDEAEAVERKLPYGKIGDYTSFFHPTYADCVVNRARALVDANSVDLRFTKRLIILSHPHFSGDNNQLHGISAAFVNVMDKQVITETELNVAILSEHDVVLLAGSHGLGLIREIKAAHPKSMVIWAGHQWFSEFENLSVWPDIIALPKSAQRPEIRERIPSTSTLILTDGVAHCVNAETVQAEALQFGGVMPSGEAFTNFVGIIIAGDAPTPEGMMKCFDPDEARSQAEAIAAHIKTNGVDLPQTAMLVVNGPRTGKHNPHNGSLIDPDPHRSGAVDRTSQVFVEVLQASFPEQVFFYDFQFGHHSAYKPLMHKVQHAGHGIWYVPAESSSMVTESTFLSAQGIPVVVYCPSSANDTHLELVRDAHRSGLISMMHEPVYFGESRTPVVPAARQIAKAIEDTLQRRTVEAAMQLHGVFAGSGCHEDAHPDVNRDTLSLQAK